MEDKEMFCRDEEGVVDLEGGEEGGDLLLASHRHILRNQCEVELPNPHLVADSVGLVNELPGARTAHEAEAPVRGPDGH